MGTSRQERSCEELGGQQPGPSAPTRVSVPAGLVCLGCFLVSTCFTLQSGNYWLEVFDNFASLNLIIFGFFEVVGVIYVYGMEQ